MSFNLSIYEERVRLGKVRVAAGVEGSGRAGPVGPHRRGRPHASTAV